MQSTLEKFKSEPEISEGERQLAHFRRYIKKLDAWDEIARSLTDPAELHAARDALRMEVDRRKHRTIKGSAGGDNHE